MSSYTVEQKKRAIELLLQYDMSYAAVVQELGYPGSTRSLRRWYEKYKSGETMERKSHPTKYTEEQKAKAVDYYLKHGKCVRRACRILGYPNRTLLTEWIKELAPDQRKNCRKSTGMVDLTPEMKKQAVADLCARTGSATQVAKKYGVTRNALYYWKRVLLPEGSQPELPKKTELEKAQETVGELQCRNETLRQEIADLERQRYRLQMEVDILTKAGEILKKDQGIYLKNLTNREKAMVIDALRDKYCLKELLHAFHMAKSSYCYQEAAMHAADKYEGIREKIRTAFEESGGCYGYRRIKVCVKKDDGSNISEKVIRHLMKDENLVVLLKKRKKYSSYQGEISPAVENLLNRDFHADKPNEKWLTDITEFSIPAGKAYLSPIIDCFDGLPVSWTIGTSPNSELVNTMLDSAIATLKEDEFPICHSDRGAHYRWPGWIERMDAAGLTRSMSKKGCSPDNSACEGFFGRLKNEMFYNRSWAGISMDDFIAALDRYIHWYAEKRIKISLGGLSPIEYRRSLGLI